MVEFAGIIVLGIFAQWLAWRYKVPAILPLILIGLGVGPISTLYTEDGLKLIEPIFDIKTGHGLFPGQSLFYFVSLSIGIILFEGGLTLKKKEIEGVGASIVRLITMGSAVTFVGAGLAAHYIMNLNWDISFLFAGLIIVTGPTVIAPILQNIPLNRNVATVLKWEGILIDPIGALVAVLVFEFIVSSHGGLEMTSEAFTTFFNIILTGLALGTLMALGLRELIRRNLIPRYLLNVFTLALVLLSFVLSDILAHESGLLTVVVMGMVLGNLETQHLKEILDFKESLSVLLISILFILLSANIDIAELELLKDWRVVALFAVVVFILRPLGVFYSTRDSDLSWNEKAFISWVGPRGIVAAGIASLFGLKLINNGTAQAEYITPLVFMIVLGTVLLNATTARLAARLLKVTLQKSSGIMIVGSNPVSRLIGKYLKESGRRVLIVDNNENSVAKAKALGLDAISGNIYSDDLEDDFEFNDIGYLMAMTSSADVNQHAVKHYGKTLGEHGAYRLVTPKEMKMEPDKIPDEGMFSPYDDFINLSEVIRDNPTFHEMPLESKEQYHELMKNLNRLSKSIPVFIKRKDGTLDIIQANFKNLKINEGDVLIYVGEKIEQRKVEEV